jgi:hypothetical protein
MSGIVTFLKKLGQILVNVAGVAVGIGPIITPFLGSGKAGTVASTVVNDLTSIGQVVVQIETAFAGLPAGSTTGAQKLQAALPLVSNIVKTSELVVGKKIANEALFTQACQEYTQATVDLLNSIHPDEAKPA